MKKFFAILLTLCMVATMSVTAFAAENQTTDITYSASENGGVDSSTWTVTVPATLTAGQSGEVKAEGSWAPSDILSVTADENVNMYLNGNENADYATIPVTYNPIALAGSYAGAVSVTETVTVDADNAMSEIKFGKWEGTLTFYINLTADPNYVSGSIGGTTAPEEGIPEWVRPEWIVSEDEKVIPEGAVTIATAEEFISFATTTTDADTYVALTANIDLADVEWTSIANFAGTFNGRGYTISNLNKNLFGTVSGTVKNLGVENVTILNTTKNGANGFIKVVADGGLVDNCRVSKVDIKWTDEVNAKDTTDGFGGVICQVMAGATVQNCGFSDITVTSNGKTKRTGGVFYGIGGTVKDSFFDGVNFTVADTETLDGYVTSNGGGLAAVVNGGAIVEDCVVNNMQVNVDDGGHLGGVFGKAHISGQTAPITLKNITVYGLAMNVGNGVDKISCIAGFIGQPDSRSNDVRVAIDNCHIYGLDMTLSGKPGESAAAGFISGLCGGVDVTNCSVSGKIDGTNATVNVGGFIGDAGWYGSIEQNITDCVADVDITVKDSIAGGFVAVDGTLGDGTAILNFADCEAKGSVTVVDGGTGTVGTFVGKSIE